MSNSFMFAITSIALSSFAASAPAAVLVQADFFGTAAAGVGSIAPGNPQITTAAGVTYDDGTVAVGSIPTTGAAWVYDGTGTAAANSNVFDSTSPNFGGTTRFDLYNGLASSGSSYTITGAEVVVRALNDDAINWSMGFRRAVGEAPTIVGGTLLTTQTGASPLTTYFIDLSAAGLSATDAASTFDRTATGRIRFLFNDASVDASADNFQVDAIRLIGSVTVPEPAVLLGLFGSTATLLVRRRRH